ncbi:LysR family transcriptional regulator [Scatolibacter rhodanostii]|uniref:LysR family transcriptional regulator n=1 Tax=Scatolibacter rhodanostii TaxID=2014781 RepID=UPI000C081057|nr:LysR family transcriptional regulator [Scatolibacter rhodanostii]
MTLLQLKYIAVIVECGSISKAAKQLFITQPSLSSAVKELEEELDIEIFLRTSRGISLTADGTEFLGYARQILEQTELFEQRYKDKKPLRQICSISTQHYAFAVNAFVNLINESGAEEYEFTLRESRTKDIIDDVATLHSEVGILYLNAFNEKVIRRFLTENKLKFHPLFNAKPHVFVSKTSPLAKKKSVTLSDLEEFPCLSFEQGEYNSFYFSEEIFSTVYHKKSLRVSDRATLFNLLIGLNGYTICSGVLDSGLNGDQIIAVPLQTGDDMQIGWIVNTQIHLSKPAERYIEILKELIAQNGFEILS